MVSWHRLNFQHDKIENDHKVKKMELISKPFKFWDSSIFLGQSTPYEKFSLKTSRRVLALCEWKQYRDFQ
jgi:hypothetical protein